jgi:hypothetical protein
MAVEATAPELATGPPPDAEPFWPAQLTAAASLALYVTLPHSLIMGPKWLVPGVEGVLLLGLVLTTLIAPISILLVVSRAVNVLG